MLLYTACYWLHSALKALYMMSRNQHSSNSGHAFPIVHSVLIVPRVYRTVLLQASFERVSAFATTIINFYIWMFNVLFSTAQKAFGAVAGAAVVPLCKHTCSPWLAALHPVASYVMLPAVGSDSAAKHCASSMPRLLHCGRIAYTGDDHCKKAKKKKKRKRNCNSACLVLS
jgi:hypothetical protein